MAARLHRHDLALQCGSRSWSYGDLNEAVAHAASAMVDLPPGRLGILADASPATLFAIHAAVRVGKPFVPLNWRLPVSELRRQLDAAGVTSLLAATEFSDFAREIVANSDVEPIQLGEMRSIEANHPGAWECRVALHQEAAILFTSGTTGLAKGARITVGNLWHSAIASMLHLGNFPTDRWLATMPLFHIGGLSILFRAAIAGVAVDLHPGFEPQSASEAIDAGATLVSLVPTTLQRLLDYRQGRPFPATLRAILLGGAPAPAALLRRCLAERVPVCPTYGLTESSSQATTLLTRDLHAKIGSSGQALPLTEIRVMQQGALAACGDIGAIELRGPTTFAGYLEESCHEPRKRDDWFSTGDEGYLDEDGFLYVVDRRTDLIVSGGENIYPAVVERVLLQHPAVSDAAVFGIADSTWGTRPVAAVVLRPAYSLADADLRTYCEQSLARFMIPDRFHRVPELPRSASGKLLRRELPRIVSQSVQQDAS